MLINLKVSLKESVMDDDGDCDDKTSRVDVDIATVETTRRSSRRRKASRVDYKEVSTSDIEDKVILFYCLKHTYKPLLFRSV